MKKYQQLIGDDVACLLCPKQCKLLEGQAGQCLVRKRVDGEIILDGYGKLCTISVEPIEKKPFFHFMPGSKTLSIGGFGCNLNCSYCENWMVSGSYPAADLTPFSPSAIVNVALAKKCDSVCFTFTEPIVYYEYVMDLADKCKKQGLPLLLKSNGLASKDAWRDFQHVAAAINIDLKYFALEDYDLDLVLDRLEFTPNLEISIPIAGVRTDDFMDVALSILDRVGDCVPLHLVKVLPAKDFTKNICDIAVLECRREAMNLGCSFVYAHNIYSDDGMATLNTYCDKCGLICRQRDGNPMAQDFCSCNIL